MGNKKLNRESAQELDHQNSTGAFLPDRTDSFKEVTDGSEWKELPDLVEDDGPTSDPIGTRRSDAEIESELVSAITNDERASGEYDDYSCQDGIADTDVLTFHATASGYAHGYVEALKWVLGRE